jgi:hypothetical protein
MVIDKQLEKLRCFYTQSIFFCDFTEWDYQRRYDTCDQIIESCQITSYFKRLDNQIQNMTEMKIIICLLTKIFNAQLGFESRDCIDKKPHMCISSFSESSLSYSPSDSSVDLDWLSRHVRPRVVKWLISIIIWLWSCNSSLRSCKWFSQHVTWSYDCNNL